MQKSDYLKPLSLGLFICLIISGCASIKKEIRDSGTHSMESQLRASGFKIMIADTKDRQELMNSLPPQTITRIARPDNVYYIYPDPNVCSCLYVGRDAEYQSLQQLSASASQSRQASYMHQRAETQEAGNAPMGPWGNYGWGLTNPNSMGRPAWDPE